MSEPFLAEIRIYGFNFPPRGWAQCDGQILQINQNQSLFSLLGTTFGGDGRTTFGLPELRGRTPVHLGAYNGGPSRTWGERSGEEAHVLTEAEMPNHQHSWQASNEAGDAPIPAGNLLGAFNNAYRAADNNVSLAPASVANAGNSQGHNNMQPYLALNFCIALQGLFPSRN